MTKLEQVIEKIKTLPESTQDQVAELLVAFTDAQSSFDLTVAESMELDRRFREMQKTHSIEEVFASL